MAADDDPIFLQVKEARKSVLEPYAGKSLHKNQGERIVAGQRLMQSASDIFLGWTRGVIGRDYYFRQLRDAKISAIPEDWDLTTLQEFGKFCAWALAQASGDPATRRRSPATWAPRRRSTTRRASSLSNASTRTFATIATLSVRSARVESRSRPRLEPSTARTVQIASDWRDRPMPCRSSWRRHPLVLDVERRGGR